MRHGVDQKWQSYQFLKRKKCYKNCVVNKSNPSEFHDLKFAIFFKEKFYSQENFRPPVLSGYGIVYCSIDACQN